MPATLPATPEALDILRADPVFGLAPLEALTELAARSRMEHYRTPTLLNMAGQPLGWLRYVIEGHLEVMARNAAGEEVALGDIGTGNWATWVGCISPTPPRHDFYSSPEARYLALPAAAVRSLCENHPVVYPRIIAELGVRMRQLMEWTGDSVLLRPDQRMAKLIDLLSRAHQVNGRQINSLQVTQSRLARLARCSRQSANTLLGGLERRGLIRIAYGRCEIVDVARLHAFINATDPEDGAQESDR